MSSPDPSDIRQLTCHYAEAQQVLFTVEQPTLRQILEVMRSRDRLQAALADNAAIDSDELERIVELDLALQQNFATVAGDEAAFQQARLSFQPPDSAWWWFLNLKPKPVPKPKLADRFDWLWNLGTVACLVVSTAFMTQTAKAFSVKGFDVLGMASTIAQGAGLVLVAGGALTDRGHKVVSKILHDLQIPPSLHAEVTFGASLIVLGSAYGINQNLPWVGNLYLQQAKAYEDANQFSKALRSYERALNFDPDSDMILISNGFLYEKIGELDKAIELYEKGARLAIPAFLNAQARAMLFRELKKNNWQPGASEKVLNEAENLLEQARNRIRNPEDKLSSNRGSQDERLLADIGLNLLILKTMQLKSQPDLMDSLKEGMSELGYSVYISNSLKTDTEDEKMTQASTNGQDRIRCFWALYNWGSSIPEDGNSMIWDQEEKWSQYRYQCHAFNRDPRFVATPDARLVRYFRRLIEELNPGYLDLNLLIDAITYNDRFTSIADFKEPNKSNTQDRVLLLRSSEDTHKWLTFQRKIIKLIHGKLSVLKDAKQDLIWRVILDSQGQIISYFKYDPYSLESSDTNLDSIFDSKKDHRKKIIQEALRNLQAGKPVEFFDFKIVVSPNGKVRHILPWAMAYPSFYQFSCDQYSSKYCFSRIPPQKVEAAFQLYAPDFSNAGEVAALRAMLYSTLDFLEWNSNSRLHYKKPLQYRLKVSADGQILQYKAQNQATIQELGQEFPRVGLEETRFKNLQRLPITYFNIEFRGTYSYQLTHESDPQE